MNDVDRSITSKRDGEKLEAEFIGWRTDGEAVFKAPSERIKDLLRTAGYEFGTWRCKPNASDMYPTLRGWSKAL